jgi:hypothetical protein
MQWIEALINISAFAGFISVANLARENHQPVDEIPKSARDSAVRSVDCLE